MEQTLDYKKLYSMQDEILDILSKTDTNFYLTGGTALHRFYYNYRFSDDLDFFTNNDANFSEYVNQLLYVFQENGILFSHPVKAKDFHRIVIKDYLQIDFVNDRVYREGISNIINKNRVDNKTNILTNKICALIDRDEEKDIFDLFSIAFNEKFTWSETLTIANKKSSLNKDYLLQRLDTFPLSWLKKINIIKPLDINKDHINIIIEDILNEKSNSLAQNNS